MKSLAYNKANQIKAPAWIKGRWRTWVERIVRYEYWPFYVFYMPVFAYYAWLAFRARSLVFCTATNPSIEHSGIVGEHKDQVNQWIPDEVLPRTLYFGSNTSKAELVSAMSRQGLLFPVVAKPNVGERGRGVQLVQSIDDLVKYSQAATSSFLVQQYIDSSFEAGVMFVKRPGQPGVITSIVTKGFATVVGDGESTLTELVLSEPRYSAKYDDYRRLYSFLPWDEVLTLGQSVLIEPIGNHSRGTEFINSNHLITPALTEAFAGLSDRIEGFYFGRFDVKAPNEMSFRAGQGITVLELNGIFSEPGHIYDKNFGLWNAYKELFRHWDWIYEISMDNYRSGRAQRSSLRAILRMFWTYGKNPQ